MADCKYTSRISAYHDGETSDAETRELEAHLVSCADCRDSLQTLKRLSGLANSVAYPPISSTFLAELRGIPTRPPWGDLLPTARLLFGVSTILLMVSIGFSTNQSRPTSASIQSWEETAARDSDPEIVEEPEADITRWVVAGLTEGVGP